MHSTKINEKLKYITSTFDLDIIKSICMHVLRQTNLNKKNNKLIVLQLKMLRVLFYLF